MSTQSFKFKLAGAVAAKTGIKAEHAHAIIQQAVNLPSRPIRKTIQLSPLGKVVLINRKITRKRYPALIETIGTGHVPYETVVNFNLGNNPKTFSLLGIQIAKHGSIEKYGLKIHEVLMGGLEGDPDTERTRPPRRQPDKVSATLEGNDDTDRTRSRKKP